MCNERKGVFLEELRAHYGALKKLEKTQSLYDIGDGACRVYIRYSKIHGRTSTFYGLRREDLQLLEEIDVIWLEHGVGRLHALFEVEHSTPVYSGLLRFNDILLASPGLAARFTVVSNDQRRSLFTRQLNRPTFRMSKLDEHCTFMEYASVYNWHRRLRESRMAS